MSRFRPLPPAPRWMPLLALIGGSIVLATLVAPRWEVQALSGGEVAYFRSSILWAPGVLVAILAAIIIGTSISLLRNPHTPGQRAVGGLITSAFCLGATFLLSRIPPEYRQYPMRPSGWIHVAQGALILAMFAFAAPLAAIFHSAILSDEDRAGEGHPGREEFEEDPGD